MRALLAVVAVALLIDALVLISETAWAAPPADPTVRIVWSAPAGCSSEEAVLHEMQRVIGGPPPRGASAHAVVQEDSPGHWSERLSTEVDGVTGERTLSADSCDGLAAATGLILAWTIDPQHASLAGLSPATEVKAPSTPSASAQPADAPPPTPPAATAPAEAPPMRPPAPAPAPAQPARQPQAEPVRGGGYPAVRGIVAIDALGDIGSWPSVGLAGRVTLGAIVWRLRFEVSFADWLSESAYAAPPLTNEGTTLHPIEGALRGCFRWELRRRLEFDPCFGAGPAYVTSSGTAETIPTHDSTAWWTLFADAMGTWAFAPPLALRLSLGIAVPLARPEFDIDEPAGVTPVFLHRAWPVAARAALGVEARFP
jgi:hypothetical protein